MAADFLRKFVLFFRAAAGFGFGERPLGFR